MTNPDLAALSEAATQGEWRTDCAEHEMPYQDIRLKSGRWNIATIGIDDAPVRDFNDAQNANAVFIVALVNAYRSGNLIQIDCEGMRERCAGAIAEAGGSSNWEHALMCADAAIAAILGGGA